MSKEDMSCIGFPYPPTGFFPTCHLPVFWGGMRVYGGSLSVRDTLPCLLQRVGASRRLPSLSDTRLLHVPVVGSCEQSRNMAWR